MSFPAASIVTAFDTATIGTKVTDLTGFWLAADAAVALHDFAADRVPGQGFVDCPAAIPFVSAGVGPQSTDPGAYICRLHRDRVSAYLRREYAAPVTGCALIVYTRVAYLADPDTTPEEVARIGDAEHVLVAVLAFAGPKAPLTPYRLISNLAGGNKEESCGAPRRSEPRRGRRRRTMRRGAWWRTDLAESLGRTYLRFGFGGFNALM